MSRDVALDSEGIRALAQIANDKRFDEETRKMARDVFDTLYHASVARRREGEMGH